MKSIEQDITLFEVSDSEYKGEDGTTLKREYGETPNGNILNGRWVLRNSSGDFIDFNQYRHDIASAYGIKLISKK